MGMWEAVWLCLTSRAPTQAALPQRLTSHFQFCLSFVRIFFPLVVDCGKTSDRRCKPCCQAVCFSVWHTLRSWAGATRREECCCDVEDNRSVWDHRVIHPAACKDNVTCLCSLWDTLGLICAVPPPIQSAIMLKQEKTGVNVYMKNKFWGIFFAFIVPKSVYDKVTLKY